MANLTPEALLDLHKSYADEFTDLANSGLQSAFSALANSGMFDYTPTQIAINMPDFGRPNTNVPLPAAPDMPTMPQLGTLASLRDIPNPSGSLTAPLMPSVLANIPNYTEPAQPPSTTPALQVIAPTVPTGLNMPATPNYLPISTLTLPYTEITIPTAPVVTMPVFDGQRPSPIAPIDPELLVTKYRNEREAQRAAIPAYVRANADALVARFVPEYDALRRRINEFVIGYLDPSTGGGLGIPAHIETGILARASGRNAEEAMSAIENAAEDMGKKGWTMPPLALLATVREATVKMGDANVKASTDIATKNLELEQKMVETVLKLGGQLEEKMLDVIGQYLTLALRMDEQALNCAKEVMTAYLGAYNLQVVVYKALWDGYATDAQVYKARIEAVEQTVRVYEAQIKAELAKTEVNKQTVEVLRAMVDMNRAMADSYRIQIEAAMAPLQVAKLQNEIYALRVQAYGHEVSAYEARWRAYSAQVEGELGKFKAYSDRAKTFESQVQAFRAQIEAYTAQVSAMVEYNKGITDRNNATLKVFETQSDVQLKTFDKLITSYDVESKAAIQQTSIELEYWRTASSLIFQEFNVATQQVFEYAREQMNLFRGQMEAAIQAGNGLTMAAQVAGNLASGAMSGLSTFAGNLVTSQGG